MPKLRGWCFTDGLGNPQKPEVNLEGSELEQTRLFGYVYDDSRKTNSAWGADYSEFADGHRVVTSPVKEVNLEEKYVKTRSGTKYELEGYMHPKYSEWLKNPEPGLNVMEMVERLSN